MPDTVDTMDVFENDILKFLKMFQEEANVEDLRRCPHNVWNAALTYTGRKLFKNTDLLKINITGSCGNFSYDLEKIDAILDYYIYLCDVYDKIPSIMAFSKLVCIDCDTIKHWKTEIYTKDSYDLRNKSIIKDGNGKDIENSRDVTQKKYHFHKKLTEGRFEALTNILGDGKKLPTGAFGILNNEFNYNAPGMRREEVAPALTASELPRLDIKNAQNAQNALLADVVNGAKNAGLQDVVVCDE